MSAVVSDGELQAKFSHPFRDGVERNADAAPRQQILDVAVAEREPIIEPNRVGDDLGGKALASKVRVGSFGHNTLNIKPIPTTRLRRRHRSDCSVIARP